MLDMIRYMDVVTEQVVNMKNSRPPNPMTPNLLTPGELAPDFEINDYHGRLVRLADFRGKQPVVLYFLRGFL